LGNVDRVLRLVFAVVVAILFFTKEISGLSGIILLIIAGVLALTSFVSFCPIYWAFGWKSTNKE
jgi:hypothetical protein